MVVQSHLESLDETYDYIFYPIHVCSQLEAVSDLHTLNWLGWRGTACSMGPKMWKPEETCWEHICPVSNFHGNEWGTAFVHDVQLSLIHPWGCWSVNSPKSSKDQERAAALPLASRSSFQYKYYTQWMYYRPFLTKPLTLCKCLWNALGPWK